MFSHPFICFQIFSSILGSMDSLNFVFAKTLILLVTSLFSDLYWPFRLMNLDLENLILVGCCFEKLFSYLSMGYWSSPKSFRVIDLRFSLSLFNLFLEPSLWTRFFMYYFVICLISWNLFRVVYYPCFSFNYNFRIFAFKGVWCCFCSNTLMALSVLHHWPVFLTF